MSKKLFTIGHSNLIIEDFIALLQKYEVTAIADVRSHPYSRYLPHFNQTELKIELLKANISYVFLGNELGARPKNLSCYINDQIDICTGKWIRPVSTLDDGRISLNTCSVNNQEPQPVDILDIPLSSNKGSSYECENLLILPGKWQKIRQSLPEPLLQYCEEDIFYSQYPKAVPFSFLNSLEPDQRRTLQLVKATVKKVHQYQDSKKWEASLSISNKQQLTAKITDIVMIEKLNKGFSLKDKECLVTISLAKPWQQNNLDKLSCWKLIAGVIELS